MNERIRLLVEQAGPLQDVLSKITEQTDDKPARYVQNRALLDFQLKKFAELIVAECMEQVEQAKNSPFVSLDDAKRMSHFVDVTTKKIRKHFGVDE